MKINQLKIGSYQTNTYIINFDTFIIIVDPADDYDKIIKHTNQLPIYAVLLTHGHFDHIGSLNQILKLNHDTILYLHENATEKLQNAKLNASYMIRKPFVVEYLPEQIKEVQDMDQIVLPNKMMIDVFYTPGHTDCSVSFRIDQHIFVGDTIFKDYIGAYHFKTGNIKELRDSCFRLMNLEKTHMIYPGHYDVTTSNYIKLHNKQYLKLIKDLS